MKPTFQTRRPSRHAESHRPQGQHVSKSPATDWSFQTTAAEIGGAIAPAAVEHPLQPSLFALTEGFFTTAEREFRFEAAGFAVLVALAAWPIALALHMAANTVG
jgi:hypothetical protein